MHSATNKVLSRSVLFLGLLLILAACGPVQLPPTPTAIPLEATATTEPLPTRVPPTAPATGAPGPTPTPPDGQAEGPAAGNPSPSSSQVSQMLAQRTARDFLDRLVAGEAGAAARLYLTAEARQGEAGQLVEQLAAAEPDLTEARLLELRPASPTSYEMRAALFRAGEGTEAGQPLTAVLIYDGGLWLVDRLSLGDGDGQQPPQGEPAGAAPAATATAAPAAAPRQPAAAAPRQAADVAGRLVFQVSSGGDIYVINADGSGLRRLADGLDPAWSPDGSRIAFTRWRVPWGVYVVPASGSAEERVVDGNQLKEVAWSPDGNRLAFTINYGSSEPMRICFFGFCFTIPPFSFGYIWLANLETGEFLNLPLDDRAVHSPAWSPDGQRIVYAGDRGLAWIDLDDMEKGRFAGSSAWDNSPAFSPDGRQVAFMGRAHDHWEIYVMNADGSGRRQLTQGDTGEGHPTNSVAPAWSPDGSRIAFLSDREGPWRFYVMGQDGSAPAALFGQELDGLGLTYDWASERVVSWSR